MCKDPCCCDVADSEWTAWSTGEGWTAPNAWCNNGDVALWSDCKANISTFNGEQTRENNKMSEYATAYFDNLLSILETEFQCQGICESSDFWLFNNVAGGRPSKPCLAQLHDDFSGSAFGGMIVLLITCLIDLLLFICMFKQCKEE
jgi:hypothetical protein